METEFEDKIMFCPCGQDFLWYAIKQKEYKEKGYKPPRFCKRCGDNRKARNFAKAQQKGDKYLLGL